jgi:hypothetical protein
MESVLYFYFYQLLTAFNKLKIMAEVVHNNWSWIYSFRKVVFDREDSSFACFIRATQSYGL